MLTWQWPAIQTRPDKGDTVTFAKPRSITAPAPCYNPGMSEQVPDRRWPLELQVGELADIREAVRLESEVAELQTRLHQAIQDGKDFPEALTIELERKVGLFRLAVLRAYPNQQFTDQ